MPKRSIPTDPSDVLAVHFESLKKIRKIKNIHLDSYKVFEVVIALDPKIDRIAPTKTTSYRQRREEYFAQELIEEDKRIKREEERLQRIDDEKKRWQQQQKDAQERERLEEIERQKQSRNQPKAGISRAQPNSEIVRQKVVKPKKLNKINPNTGFDPRSVTTRVQDKISPTKTNKVLKETMTATRAPPSFKIPKKSTPSVAHKTTAPSMRDEELDANVFDPLSDILGSMTGPLNPKKKEQTSAVEDVARSPVKTHVRTSRVMFEPKEDQSVHIRIPDMPIDRLDGDDMGILSALINNKMQISPKKKIVFSNQEKEIPIPEAEIDDIQDEFHNAFDQENQDDNNDNESDIESSDEEAIGKGLSSNNASLINVHDDLDFEEEDDSDDDEEGNDGNFKRNRKEKGLSITTKKTNQVPSKRVEPKQSSMKTAQKPMQAPPVVQATPVAAVDPHSGRKLVAMDIEPEKDVGKKAMRAARFAASTAVTVTRTTESQVTSDPIKSTVTTTASTRTTSSLNPSLNHVRPPLMSRSPMTETVKFMHHNILFGDQTSNNLFSEPVKKTPPSLPAVPFPPVLVPPVVQHPMQPTSTSQDPRLTSRASIPPVVTFPAENPVQDLIHIPRPENFPFEMPKLPEKLETHGKKQGKINISFDEQKLLRSFGKDNARQQPRDHSQDRRNKTTAKHIIRETSGFSMKSVQPVVPAVRYKAIADVHVIDISLEPRVGLKLTDPRIRQRNESRRRNIPLPLFKLFPNQQEAKNSAPNSTTNSTRLEMHNLSIPKPLPCGRNILQTITAKPIERVVHDPVSPVPLPSKPKVMSNHNDEPVKLKGSLPSDPRMASMITEMVEMRAEYQKEKKKKSLSERIRSQNGQNTRERANGHGEPERLISKDMKIKVRIPNGIREGKGSGCKKLVRVIRRKKNKVVQQESPTPVTPGLLIEQPALPMPDFSEEIARLAAEDCQEENGSL